MCCIFCVSFRGAAYFASSAQILLGLAIVLKYSTSIPDVKWQDFQSVGSGPIVILFTYGLIIFGFGCCIFKAIELESLRTMKVMMGGLTILQSLVLITHLVLISLAFDSLPEEERMVQVSVLALNLVMTFVLLTIYFLYMIRLARREWAVLRRRESCNGSGSSVPLSSNSTTLNNLKGGVVNGGRSSVGTLNSSSTTLGRNSFGTPQRYVDGHWENLQA